MSVKNLLDLEILCSEKYYLTHWLFLKFDNNY